MNNENKINFALAVILSIAIIVGWNILYEKPRLYKSTHHQTEDINNIVSTGNLVNNSTLEIKDRIDAINYSNRVKIMTNKLRGSISLKGLRFDDLVLVGYKKDISENSPDIELLSPVDTHNAYFAEIGWSNINNTEIELPDSHTIWQVDKNTLADNDTATFTWTNKQNITFVVNITVDSNYMFTIEQQILNRSDKHFSVHAYGLIQKSVIENEKSTNILHQGPIAAIDGRLIEVSYDSLKDKKQSDYASNTVNWVGITDKYWLTSFIPDTKVNYSINFVYTKSGNNKYQVSFLSSKQLVEPNSNNFTFTHQLFLGAKQVKLLDYYSNKYNIKLFDRAIDFGWFYVITKPLFYTLSFFYQYCGNFGVSILIVTVLVKLAMFTLANRSYRSMKRMKEIQPQLERIKEIYGDDKARLNQEMIALYQKAKINPVAGCLPVLLQIPVFFSLYKVLNVTIEMRHAQFFGWIQDLSALDPTSIFNLFGLVPFDVPSFLHIGAWPILTAATMMLQQRMGPPIADPVHAQVMRVMPLVFLIMFSNFPAGLLIYWTWNNILSIIQQTIINKLENK